MSDRVIIDLRRPLRDFAAALSHKVTLIPEYVFEEVVKFVFDIFIYELEDCCEDPDLTRLGNFYRDYIESDPRFHKLFLESFFELMHALAAEIRAHGFYTGDGFEFHPERIRKNRSIVVRKFNSC